MSEESNPTTPILKNIISRYEQILKPSGGPTFSNYTFADGFERHDLTIFISIVRNLGFKAETIIEQYVAQRFARWLMYNHPDHVEFIYRNRKFGSYRHCAHCLKFLTAPKLCGKCKKRAFCSKECQQKDWHPTSEYSQGHQRWCGIEYGEEDIDWVVRYISGKGFGLVAKRSFVRGSRILVEPLLVRRMILAELPLTFDDLTPWEGSASDKFLTNALGVDGGVPGIAMRISRSNHDCDPNAAHKYDSTFKVKILFAERDINVGDEICISYTMFNDLLAGDPEIPPSTKLLQKWGIVCPDDCFYQKETVQSVVKKAKSIYKQFVVLINIEKYEKALDLIDELLSYASKAHVPLMSLLTIYSKGRFAAFNIGNFSRANEYEQKALGIWSNIFHPKSKELVSM